MIIQRKRWVIIRNSTDIFCWLARNYGFREILNIGNATVKTYSSKNKAIAAFNKSWGEDYDDEKYSAIEVYEKIETEEWQKNNAPNGLAYCVIPTGTYDLQPTCPAFDGIK